MSWTYRPQNRCKGCHYTWHPRGKDRSLRCPNCGSSDVEILNPSIQKAGCGCLAFLLLLGCCLIFQNRITYDREDHEEKKEQKQLKAKGSDEESKVVVANEPDGKVEPKQEEKKKQKSAKPGSKISRANFDRIQRGWTVEDVTDTIGVPTQTKNQEGLVVRIWQDDPTVIRIHFSNSRVWAKYITD